MELISKEAVIDLINNPPLYLSLGGMSKEDLLKGIEELPIIEVECFGIEQVKNKSQNLENSCCGNCKHLYCVDRYTEVSQYCNGDMRGEE